MRVRAIIIEHGRLLLIERVKQNQHYWVFPGGGVEDSDKTPKDALIRECLEELNIRVEVGVLYDTYSGKEEEQFYLCRIISGTAKEIGGPESGRNPEVSGTYKPVWLKIAELEGKQVFPESIKRKVLDLGVGDI